LYTRVFVLSMTAVILRFIMKFSRSERGFTLIELLVVISIISMLSSVLLVALGGARQKGRAAAVQQEALQLRNWFEQQRTSTGSYSPAFATFVGTPVQDGTEVFYTFTTPADCSAKSTDTQFITLCNAIVANNSSATNSLLVGGPGSSSGSFTWTSHNLYSIMAQLPNNQTYICVGSGGINTNNVASGLYATTGCLANP
jgi:prepilin-type N-terminal cleavage/methylation domain-containing protein